MGHETEDAPQMRLVLAEETQTQEAEEVWRGEDDLAVEDLRPHGTDRMERRDLAELDEGRGVRRDGFVEGQFGPDGGAAHDLGATDAQLDRAPMERIDAGGQSPVQHHLGVGPGGGGPENCLDQFNRPRHPMPLKAVPGGRGNMPIGAGRDRGFDAAPALHRNPAAAQIKGLQTWVCTAETCVDQHTRERGTSRPQAGNRWGLLHAQAR